MPFTAGSKHRYPASVLSFSLLLKRPRCCFSMAVKRIAISVDYLREIPPGNDLEQIFFC